MSTTVAPEGAQATKGLADPRLDIAATFPADPDLMVSPEGDARGLEKLQHEARAREADADS